MALPRKYGQTCYQRFSEKGSQLSLLFTAVLPLLLLVSLFYLWSMPLPEVDQVAYLLVLHAGHFPLLVGLPLLLLLASLFWLPSKWFVPSSHILLLLILTALLADTLVYALYRFHLSPFIFDLILRSGKDTFEFSGMLWLTIAAVLVMLLICYGLSVRYLLPRISIGFARRVIAVSLASLLAVHLVHAYQDARYDTDITSLSRHAPLFYGTTAKRFMVKHGLVDASEARRAGQLRRSDVVSSLRYPQSSMQCNPVGRPENILLLVVDSLRADTLSSEWMPHSYDFSRSASRFHQHFSGGNSTLPGIFSLFYGLPANYWDAFYGEQQAPVLTDRLLQLDYQMQIWSAATLVSPAFDRTVFSGVEGIRLQTPGDGSWQQDRQITDDWLAFTDGYDGEQPFFGFLFFSSVHGTNVPPDYPRIEPFWEDVNQLALLFDDGKREPYQNVHRTAAHYVDSLIAEILNDLRARNLLDRTWVVITSDHGEEFNDNQLGYWGHGSNFSDVQLQVPLIIHRPGEAGMDISHRTTHYDFAPTLFQRVLGCGDTAAANYSVGMDLYNPAPRRQFLASSYAEYGVVTDSRIVLASPGGRYLVQDKHLQPTDESVSEVLDGAALLETLSRFYQ